MNTANLDLVVRGLVQSGDAWTRQEVHISGGRITAITNPSETSGAKRELDMGNSYLIPGMVDAHVHSLSPHQLDLPRLEE
jgi:allantoinase